MYYGFYADKHTFLQKCDGPDVLRVLGHPWQFPLIQKHYHSTDIEVCSLNQLNPRKLPDPDYAIATMQKIDKVPAHGGWRKLKNPEAVALYLGSFNGPVEEPSDELLTMVVDEHPLVNGGIGFCYGNKLTQQLLNMMGLIYDIRRFSVDGAQRMRILKNYFKLNTPAPISKFLKKSEPTSAETARAAVVYMGWAWHPFAKLTYEEAYETPGAFLYRHYRTHLDDYRKNHNEEKSHALAVWDTSIKYLEFMQKIWLHGLGDECFTAEKFFDTPKDVDNFEKYIKNLDFAIENFGTGY